MALEVEDGTGKSNAESYLSVADTTTYLTSYLFNFSDSDWKELTDTSQEAQQEVALRQATRYLDNTYHSAWLGCRNTRDQALDWPRSKVTDNNNFAIPSDEVPREVKQATAILANIALTEDLEPNLDADETGAKSSDEVKVGPIKNKVEWMGSPNLRAVFTAVDGILQPILDPSSLGVNVARERG